MKHVPPERVKYPHCVGTRDTWKQIPQQNTFAQWSYSLCDHCAGQGYLLVSFTTPTNRCPVCYGLGYAYAEDFVLVDLPPSLTNGTEYLLQYFGHKYEGYPQAGDVLVKFEHQLLASHSLQLHNTFDVLYTHTIQHLSQLILSSSSFSYQPHLLAIVIANSLLSAFLDDSISKCFKSNKALSGTSLLINAVATPVVPVWSRR